MVKAKVCAYSLGILLQLASQRIGIIDFYGYGSLDLAQLRAALPFREGGGVPSERQMAAARESIKKLSGRADASIEMVCCSEHGRFTVFVGLAEPGVETAPYYPRPGGEVRLPAEAAAIFKRMDAELFAAVRKNQAQEDDSEGYALMQYRPLRIDQLRLLVWARAHADVVYQVLETSRHDGERANAAAAVGYLERSPQQIAALVRASDDPDEGVRNNAVRALGVLCRQSTEVARQVPAARFIRMLHSLRWTDRNKSLMLLEALTQGRDRNLLDQLRTDALEDLREMARWKDQSHGMTAAILVGRIAGIEEQRLIGLAMAGKVDEILSSAR